MKLYNSIGPNPRVVNMFIAEKGIEIPKVEVDIMAGENRQPAYLAVNPTGQCPALEMQDGNILNEVTVICDYLEALHPEPVLIGSTPEQQAISRMWCRRIDLKIAEPMANGFRYAEGLGLFKDRMRCLPEASEGLKACAQDGLAWLEEQMADKPYITGDKAMLPDIFLFCVLEFFTGVGQQLNPEYTRLKAWYEKMAARPSVAASVHPSQRR